MYQIKNIKGRKKLSTQYIILTHVRNLVTKQIPLINEDLKRGSYHYTYGEWQKYFYVYSYKDYLPFHYFAELLDKDYVIYNGVGINQRSYFIEDLIKARILPERYLNSIVIGIQEDFSIDVPDKRLFSHLCDKVINPLMMEYKLDNFHVLYLDEILSETWEVKIDLANIPKYQIKPATYFDKNILISQMNYYKKT